MPFDEAMRARRRRSVRLPWGATDQIVSAAGNSLIVVLAARRLAPTDLGSFAVAMSLAMIGVGLARAWTSQPLAIEYSAESMDQRRAALLGALRAALLLSAVMSGALLVPALVLGGDLGAGLVVVALGLPVLLVQDVLRLSFFVLGPDWGAAAADLAWTVVVTGAFLVPALDSTTMLLCWWIGGAGVGAVVAAVHLRRVWSTALAPEPGWFGRHRRLSTPLFLDSVLVTAYGHLVPVILAIVLSLEASGIYRVALTTVGPLTAIVFGSAAQALPALVRERAMSERVRGAQRFSERMVVLALAYTAAIALVPAAAAEWVLGPVWDEVRAPAIVLGVSAVAGAAVQGALLALRAGGQVGTVVRFRAALFPVQFALVVVFASHLGAVGAALGLAIGSWIAVPLWWSSVARHARSHRSGSEATRAGVA